MIGALLRECGELEGVARLFTELGYPVRPVRVDDSVFGVLGVDMGDLPVHHLARCGGVDLYAASPRSDEQRNRLRELERVLTDRNRVIKPVILELGGRGEERLVIRARCGRARRRLDIDIQSPSADVIDRICGLRVEDRDDAPDTGGLFDRALDREAVGRRFFEQFRESTLRLTRELRSTCATESAEDCSDHALLLLSRVLFVYFVQRKGWLAGDHRFIRERLASCVRRRKSFHASILDTLFFDCLNTPLASRSAAAGRLGRIPYLNGGLFEPTAFEQRNEIEFSNELWEEILDSTFEPFSLSVSEGDEEGAHIDPEMLGKVFEKLMASDERARTGTFYTPREVVDRLAIAAIVRWCGRGDDDLTARLAALVRGERESIDARRARNTLRRLEAIRVLDPACGSGAFLLAALRTIESLTRTLMQAVGEVPPADLRAGIAATSLYGVDVKMEAVRLCELRIWLAIVSGSNLDIDSVPPLPNLDRNVLQGDSLIGPLDFLAYGRAEIYREWHEELRARNALIAAYRHSSSSERNNLAGRLRQSDHALARALLKRSLERDREELRTLREGDRPLFEGAPELWRGSKNELEARIESTRRHLDRLDRHEVPFFSYELHFANVFAIGGFSVVLGNPPWVRGSKVEPGRRRLLADRYRSFSPVSTAGFRQTELAMAFVERALALTAGDGVFALLVPSKVMNADYGRQARELLASEATIHEIVDWSTDGRSLFGADVFPLGIVASRSPSKTSAAVQIDSSGECFSIELDRLGVSGPGSPWSPLPPRVRAILDRLRDRFEPMVEVLGRAPVMGVKTGANKTFFLEHVDVDEGFVRLTSLGIELPARAVVRTVRGRDLRKWKAVDSTWMLWPPALLGDAELARTVAKKLGIGLDALRLSYVKSEHLGLKVAWKDVSRGLSAAILPDRTIIDGLSFAVVPNQTLYSIDAPSRDDALVLGGLLNSTVVNALALEIAERAKDHHWRYMASVVGSLPFPRLDPGDENYISLVKFSRREELGSSGGGTLDRLVARIYGLGGRDLKVLEGFVRQRLGQSCELA